MPISADQWRAVVGSNSVRRPRQVVSIEQLLLNKLTKTLSQQNGGDTTLGTSEDATLDATGLSIQPETPGCTLKGCSNTPSDVEEVAVMISAVCVQVLQSFVSLVTLSLLILSGDVETNPGPTYGKDTPEYRTIVACTAMIKNSLAQGAAEICDVLFSKGKISDKTNYDIINASNGRRQASILFEAVKEAIVLNSEVFHTFVYALKESGPWTEDMRLHITKEYEKEGAPAVNEGNPAASQLQTASGKSQGHPAAQMGPIMSGNAGPFTPSPTKARIAQTTSQKLDFTTLLRNKELTEEELKKQLDGNNISDLARLFDDVNFYVDKLQLSSGDKTDVHRKAVNYGTHLAMKHALECWKSRNPLIATFEELLLIVLDLEKGEIAINICDYYKRKYKPSAAAKQPVYPTYPDPTHNEGAHDTRQKKHVTIAEKGYQKQTNNSGNFLRSSSTDESSPVPHHVYCGQSQVEDPKGTVPAGTAAGQCDPKKLWAITAGKDVLKVYFMNENALASVGLNTQNIMDAARMWNHYDPSGDLEVLKDLIPKFEHTRDWSKSDIRVKIELNGRSWTEVGIAAIPVDKSQPTMTLGLIPGNMSYNRHIVIHEFGHALGLEHEHQRSKFWSVAEKFLDINKMKQDNDLSNTNVDGDYLQKCPPGGSAEYDPESIMHYWFRKEWLKDQYMLYQNVANVVTATEAELSPVEKKVLLGIHSRDGSLADKPSNTDYEYLAREYYYKKHSVYLSIPSSIGAGSGSVPPPGGPAAVGSQAPVNSTDDTNVPIGLLIDFNDEGQPVSEQSPGLLQPLQPLEEITDNNQGEFQPNLTTRDDADGFPGPCSLPDKDSVAARSGKEIHSVSAIAKALGQEEVVKKLREIETRLHSKTSTIGFIGATSSGKSTTLNAILGDKFLPSSAVGETAYVLCIKHHSLDESELHDMDQQIGETRIAAGKADKICEKLKSLNKAVRSNPEPNTIKELMSLELCVPIHFLANKKEEGIDIAIYDTPGTSENQRLPHHQAARHTCEEIIEGIVLVLSVDTIQSEATENLLASLDKKFPFLFQQQGSESRRLLVVMNKKDKLHEVESESAEETLQEITKNAKHIDTKHLLCYSALLALNARTWKHDPTSKATQKEYKKGCVLPMMRKFPEVEDAVDEIDEKEGVSLEEKVIAMAKLVEETSSIKELEETILKSSSNFKILKAIDDTKNQVEKLRCYVQQELNGSASNDQNEVFLKYLSQLLSTNDQLKRLYNVQP